MVWHKIVIAKLKASGLFREVNLVGSKVRAVVDDTRFLDIHYDPTTRSYSYAFIDLRLPYPGDKRVFGWDDYPHEGVEALRRLETHPHHFQRRDDDGTWIFAASQMRGNVEEEIDMVIAVVRDYLTEG